MCFIVTCIDLPTTLSFLCSLFSLKIFSRVTGYHCMSSGLIPGSLPLDISNLPCPFYTLENFLVFSVSGCLRDSLLASKMEMFFLYASSFSLPSLWVQVNPLLCMACLAPWTFQGTVLFLGSIMYGYVCFPPKTVNSLKRGGFLFIFITSASRHLAGSQ